MSAGGQAQEIALVVHPDRRGPSAGRDAEARLDEAIGLAAALDLSVAAALIAQVREARPSTLFGAGKLAEIGEICEATGAGVVVVDDALTPVQQRNLERAWNAKVVDRTGLILEIFARRARTAEGRLQVELARLDYERSRLVRTGPISSGNGAASASWADRAKPRSRPTAG